MTQKFYEFNSTPEKFLARWTRTVYPSLLDMVGTCRYAEPQEPQSQHSMSCWPFLRHAYHAIGIDLPEDIYFAQSQFEQQPQLIGPYAKRFPMDLIYLSNELVGERHVGLATKDGFMLHSSSITNGVAQTALGRLGWAPMIKSTWRHVLMVELLRGTKYQPKDSA